MLSKWRDPIFGKTQTVWALTLIITALLFVQTGCATRKDVKEIVDSSNALILTSTLSSDLPGVDAAGKSGSGNWKKSVAKIEEFITQNPDRPRINNTLRMREAVLLISAKQWNQASVALEEIDPKHLSKERDKALYEARESILWWYRIGGESPDGLPKKEVARGRTALINLAGVADKLKKISSTRRLLEQMRVRIAMRLARTYRRPEHVRPILEDGLERYAAQFEESEHALIQKWHKEKMKVVSETAVLENIRWYDYVPQAFKLAGEIWKRHILHGEPPLDIPGWVKCMEDQSCP